MDDITSLRDGLLIGREGPGGKLMRYDWPSHLLTMAPTRSGKGVGTIIPNLLTQNRSIVCIDPKGENARITARARSEFGQVHILDPFGVTGQPSAAYNPLSALDPDSPDIAEDAALLPCAIRARQRPLPKSLIFSNTCPRSACSIQRAAPATSCLFAPPETARRRSREISARHRRRSGRGGRHRYLGQAGTVFRH